MNPEIYTPKKYPWYKELWLDIKYYCWNVPSEWYYNVKWFFGNLWRFRKILWKYRTWDFAYCAELFADSLDWLAYQIKNGHEVQKSANRKAKAIRETAKLFRYLVDDSDFDTWNEKEGKYKMSGDKLEQTIKKRKNNTIDKISHNLKGQDLTSMPYTKEWYKEFNGTGYEGWWD